MLQAIAAATKQHLEATVCDLHINYAYQHGLIGTSIAAGHGHRKNHISHCVTQKNDIIATIVYYNTYATVTEEPITIEAIATATKSVPQLGTKLRELYLRFEYSDPNYLQNMQNHLLNIAYYPRTKGPKLPRWIPVLRFLSGMLLLSGVLRFVYILMRH